MSAADLELVRRLVGADHGLAIVATTRPDGSVQASLVNAGVMPDPDAGADVVAFVARSAAAKLRYLRDRPRATVVFRAGWEWASVEGSTRIIGPDDTDAETLRLLLRDIFRAAGGTHDDWDEFDRVMQAERRAAVLVQAERITSN